MIEVKELTKVYKVAKKKGGIAASIKSLIHREYDNLIAVDHVSFKIREGEVVAFIGPNGAGKTSTLKILSGIMYPTSGTVQVSGYIPWQRKADYQRKISMVMGQRAQLWWDLPAVDSFKLQKDIYRIPNDEYSRRLHNLVDILNVSHVLHTPVRLLSLGERMKMELIGALLHNPSVLYLDEPTIGLDMFSQESIHQFLSEIKSKGNTTVMLTSHSLQDIEALCERAIVMNHGAIVYDGSLNQLAGISDSGISGALKDLLLGQEDYNDQETTK